MLVSIVANPWAAARIVDFTGEELVWDKEQRVANVKNGELILCDSDVLPVSLKAREMVVYPDQVAILRGVTYYEGRLPLFYWPTLIVPLDGTGSAEFVGLPQVGYSSVEGLYLKTAFPYYQTNSFGKINLDYYTNMGKGVGLDHYYNLLGQGLISAYTIEGRLWQLGLEHFLEEGPFNLELLLSHEQDRLLSENNHSHLSANLSYAGEYHSLSLQWEQEFTDHLLVDEESRVDVLPELIWQLEHPQIPGQLELSIGRFREFGNREGWRERVNYQVYNRWALPYELLLELIPRIEWSHYGDESQLTLGNEIQLSQTTPSYSWMLTHGWREVDGQSPFEFDRLEDAHYLLAQAGLANAWVGVDMVTSYDLYEAALDDILIDGWLAHQGWTYQLSAGLSGEDFSLLPQTHSLEYLSGEEGNISLTGYYYPEVSLWEEVEARLEIPLIPTWSMEYQLNYSFVFGEMMNNEIALTKRFDCRQITLSYDTVYKEVWLEYRMDGLF